jgi:hypothetical protein
VPPGTGEAGLSLGTGIGWGAKGCVACNCIVLITMEVKHDLPSTMEAVRDLYTLEIFLCSACSVLRGTEYTERTERTTLCAL